MKEIILTIDYELFLGEITGTTKECMIEPTQSLASSLDKNNSKMTIFWDILHYYRLLEIEKSFPELLQRRLLIEEQILNLIKRGHDVQLHLHPNWLDAKYENNKWNFTYDRFKLHNLSSENNSDNINTILGCITISKKLMEDTIRKVSPGYKVTTFRAGGYLVEPFEKLRAAFYENGIKTDSSVCPNLVNDDGVFSYDFRFYPNIQKYKFELSPKDILSDGNFYEVPITTVKIPVFTNMLFILIRIIKYSNLEIERKGSGTGKVFQSFRILNYKKILSLFRPRITQLTTDSNFKERFSYLLKKVPDYSTMILHPKLLNHHTLGFLHDYVSTNKIRFISIQEFLTKSIS